MSVVARLSVVIGANIAGLTTGINEANNKVNTFKTGFENKLDSIGGKLTQLGTGLSMALAPLTGFGYAGIQTAQSFENAMTEISTRTGLVGEDLKSIERYALRMGSATIFSAQDSAEAFLQLLTSGQSVEEAFVTLPEVLAAAAASGADLGSSADLITDIMASFGLEADQAGTVTDALSRAAGASSADMISLGQGFANVGGVANMFGISVNETAAILALFSENGIKGSEAGTQLRSMLLNMNRDTKPVNEAWRELGISMYDSEGKIRPLKTVITELDEALDGMTTEDQNRLMSQLAGSYGILGLNALRGSISMDDMQEAMEGSTTAAEISEAKMQTLTGKFDELGGSVETLMIEAFTPFNEDVLKPMAENLTEIVNSITNWVKENPQLTQQIIVLAGGAIALGAALLVGGTLITGFSAALTGLRIAALFLSGPIGMLVLAVGGLIALISDTGVQQGLAAWGEAFNTLGVIIGRLSDRVGRWFNNMVRDVQVAVLEMVGGLRDAIYEMSGGTIDIAPNINAQIADIKALKLTSTFVDSFTQLLGHHLGREDMDLSGMSFGVDFGDGNMSTVLMSSVLPNDSVMVKQWANDMGFEARNALTESLAKLAGEGDITGLKMLAPLALELGIATPSDEMREAVSEKLGDILATGNLDDFAYFLQLAVQADIGMDTPKLAGMFRQMVMGALEEDPEFDVSVYAMVAAMLGVDMDDIEGQVTGAIEGGNYDTSVNVNVNPIIKLIGDVVGAITSQIPSTVTKAVSVAASVGGGILGALGVPFFETGTPRIMRDGLGYLHEGEAVLNKAQADAWRAGMKSGVQAVAVGGGTVVNHYHINSYGQSPAQLARLLDKELKLSGR